MYRHGHIRLKLDSTALSRLSIGHNTTHRDHAVVLPNEPGAAAALECMEMAQLYGVEVRKSWGTLPPVHGTVPIPNHNGN